jgi:DNA-binding NarL/FixJ family response regulator
VLLQRGYLDSGAATVLDRLEGDAVLVLGPAGAGRTTLLADLAAIEVRRSRRVLWCRGHRHGGPSGDVGGPEMEPDGLARLLRDAPTTLLVDDAHLLDDRVLDTLGFVAERRRELGLRVAVARRTVRPRSALAMLDAALASPDGACHLAPLAADALAGWAAAAGEEDPDAIAGELRELTGGWPELVGALVGRRTGADDPVADLVLPRLGILGAEHQRVICSLAFGLPPGSSALCAATGLDHERIDAAIDAAVAEGLLHEGTMPVPAVGRALRAAATGATRVAVAAAAQSAPPALAAGVAWHLATLDEQSPEAAHLYEIAATSLSRDDPANASALYDRAIAAGRHAAPLAAGRAQAALAAGFPERAVTIARDALAPGTAPDRARLLTTTGAAWMHLGRPDLAVASFLAAAQGEPGTPEAAPAAALAVVAQAASGGPALPPDALVASRLPTDPVGLMADAALAWAAGDAVHAAAVLQRGANLAEAMGGVDTLPDSPHAVGSLLAAHELDAAAARRMAAAASAHAVGGAAFEVRHKLLSAWGALRSGRVDEARSVVDATAARTPRDQLVRAALVAAVALRDGAPGDLAAIHQEATEARARADPDLFSVDLVVELAHLAARAGADPEAVLAPIVQSATADGAPAFLTVSLAWARVLLASLVEDAGAAGTASATLVGLADTCAPARVLAPAAVAFAHVLAGAVDPDEVRQAAKRLAEHGLVFEASRLLGAAGLRCADPGTARQLLSESRKLRGARRVTAAQRSGMVEPLSSREREVARRLLDGESHREIGRALFISAKTVEHHVARIRQKVGAKSRAELLAAVRDDLAMAGDPDRG